MKYPPIHIIGIDCAVDPANVGLAFAVVRSARARLLDVTIEDSPAGIVKQITKWVGKAETALLALDAPLGWPRHMGIQLAKHTAGQAIAVEANSFFRRATDRKVKRTLGVQSLDVGADRIARTALAALELLADVRAKTGFSIPLAWDPQNLIVAQAIEVYPASTLVAHGLKHTGYKDADRKTERKRIVDALSREISLGHFDGVLADNADVLDATLCVLAGVEFLKGEAMKPDDLEMDTAKREGWIWTRPDLAE